MAQTKPSILVVEDDHAILSGLLDLLVFHGFTVEGVSDGETGLERALAGAFDLVILDVMLPGMDGFALCKTLKSRRPAQAVLMLTAKGAEDDVVHGLGVGADDYVTKPFSLKELLARVEAVLRRVGRDRGDGVLRLGGVAFDFASLTAAREEADAHGGVTPPAVAMTRRELDLVRCLHRHAPGVVSRGALLAEVWGYPETDIETRTVDAHVAKLRRKLETLVGDRPFIAAVRGEGYRLHPDLLEDAS